MRFWRVSGQMAFGRVLAVLAVLAQIADEVPEGSGANG